MSQTFSALLWTHPACLKPRFPAIYPETPERLDSLLAHLQSRFADRLPQREAPLARNEDLTLVHTPSYIEKVFDLIPTSGVWALDDETLVAPESGDAARYAAGAALAATDSVLSGETTFAFCAVRPPGHHARADHSSGFCLFNSIALAAKAALNTGKIARATILDFDVHHGDGTQSIVQDDPRLFYASSHQNHLIPHAGERDDRGPHGTVLNVPLPPETDSSMFREAYLREILPALRRFKPEMLFISAGFDGHKDDPLSGWGLTEADYGWLGTEIRKLAAETAHHRVVASLEGGYNVPALAHSAEAFLEPFVTGRPVA